MSGDRALLAASVALLATALGVLSYAVVTVPSAAPNYLGRRGLKRSRGLRDHALWAAVEPPVRWLATHAGTVLTSEMRAHIDRQLVLAGDVLGLSPEDVVASSVLSSLLALCWGTVYGFALGRGPLFMILSGPLGAALPYLQIASLAQQRLRRFQDGLPSVIDLLSLGLSAGLDFPGSLRQVVDKSSNPNDPLVEELSLVLQDLNLGKTRKEALLQLAVRIPGESVQEFVSAVVQAEEQGTPLSHVLRIQAIASRQRRSVRAEEQAAKAGVRMIAPLALLFAAIIILIVVPMVIHVRTEFSN
jgi:tight adherence protein C